MAVTPPSLRLKLLVIGVLYFAEGLPYGFVVTALSFYLRGQGVPLEQIGLVSLLGLAWSFKFLWSPLVDRYGIRAAWLVPAQGVMVLCFLGLAHLSPGPVSPLFFVLVGLLCLASATQDLAADAYAVDILEAAELGLANGVRNGAYRVGSLAAGSGLLILSDRVGWQPAFVGAGVMMGVLALTVLVAPPFRLPRAGRGATRPGGFGLVREAVRGLRGLPSFGAIILFTLTFKAGDALMATMVSPFWRDQGFSGTEFGVVSGLLGSLATIVGGLLGGALTSRWGIGTALWSMGLLQAVSNLGYFAAALPGMGRRVLLSLPLPFGGEVPIYPIYLASQGESLTGGMGSAAFMAFLMCLCDKRFSAMHYAFFAMLFSFGARIFGYLGGLLAAALGYPTFFLVSFLAAMPAFMLLPWILPVVREREGRGPHE
ncbi:MAG: MFS transporter [Desulfobaccales bacterium]